MKHVKALAIKFVASLVLLSLILGLLFDMAFSNIFLITLVLGVAAYLIGDLLILPRTNNTIATIADFGLALFIIWLMSENLTYGDNHFLMSLIAAVGVALFEYMFHKYVANNIVKNKGGQQQQTGQLQYQTEASEELTPVRQDVRSSQEENQKPQ
ncbi:YndM family protein [Neobacillus sp. DY30]|uniref:YndM family protein n=1 Tax=Neobacillus sp. DY30 TaxID=3047871 RepID=UPI0024BFB8D1|nr:YndM family protein [Neobacillus sp. DY30]WHX98347.1 YndM family protein [Neobacillus sp. DY30]